MKKNRAVAANAAKVENKSAANAAKSATSNSAKAEKLTPLDDLKGREASAIADALKNTNSEELVERYQTKSADTKAALAKAKANHEAMKSLKAIADINAAVVRKNNGEATEEDNAAIAAWNLDKHFERMAKAIGSAIDRELDSLKAEFSAATKVAKSPSAAVRNLLADWNVFAPIFKSIGLKKSDISVELLKEVVSLLKVATAEGCKVAMVTRRVIRKADGTPLKVDGVKQYEYNLSVVSAWDAMTFAKVMVMNAAILRMIIEGDQKQSRALLDSIAERTALLEQTCELLAAAKAAKAAAKAAKQQKADMTETAKAVPEAEGEVAAAKATLKSANKVAKATSAAAKAAKPAAKAANKSAAKSAAKAAKPSVKAAAKKVG